ncbi:nuclear transport factor 2 family protein [Olsenella profusa]|uniref:Nuclear transport factor 2 family protein n=1 Tax=Olsenella profusa TaxID=138595 RepID=A0ABS2F2K9_9ACTN|nr:nuclear transport factor 2 family protein [Olsenella profusa]MBM6775190.1 nuclear transport factor 2 family protein [Olsenella profusa]
MNNKEIVLAFYEEVFNAHDLSNVERYVREDYIQHNPTVEDGRAGFVRFAEKFLSMDPKGEIVKTAAEGDMVFVFFKCTMGNSMVNKVCDIYCLEDGMLAEHWDIIEHDVGDVESVNGNGLF